MSKGHVHAPSCASRIAANWYWYLISVLNFCTGLGDKKKKSMLQPMAMLMPCQELQCDKLGLIQNWWVETWEGQVHHNPGLHAWILAGSSCRGRSAQNCVCNLFQFWVKSLWSSSNISTYDGSPYRRAGKLHSSLLRWSCHLQWNWKSVLHKLSEAGLPIKSAKCQFIAIYNNACNFHSYCLNWEPKFFKFLLDCFHWVHLSHIAGGSMGQTAVGSEAISSA